MAEINLLQTNNDKPTVNPIWSKLVYVFALLLVLAAVGGYLLLRNSNASLVQEIAAEDLRHQELEKTIRGHKDYSTLLSAQDKVKVITTILNKHVDWSRLIPTIAEATYKDAVFDTFSAESRNLEDAQGAGATASITGAVSSLKDLDKLVKGMKLKDFSNNIRDVKFVSMTMNKEDADKRISFELRVTFNNAIIHAAD